MLMEDAPDVHVAIRFHEEDQEGEPPQRPASKAGEVQFMGVPQGADGGVAADTEKRPFHCVHERQGGLFAAFGSVVGDGFLDVLGGSCTWNDRFARHAFSRPRI